MLHPIVPQLNKCLKFVAFREAVLYSVQSFLSPRKDLNFIHLSSCATLEKSEKCHSSQFHELFLVM